VLIKNSGYVEPVYLQNIEKKDLFDPDVRTEKMTAYDENSFPTQVLKAIASQMEIPVDFESFRRRRKTYLNGPRPVYVSTALQIGMSTNEYFKYANYYHEGLTALLNILMND
jgi:hypothetical protein